MKFYIAGPMSNRPQFNFPLFDKVAQELRAGGYEIVSPAELDNQETRELALQSPDGAMGSGTHNGETWMDFLVRDLKLVADEVDGVVALPEWETSRGAKLETYCARLCNKPIYQYVDGGELIELSQDILEAGWLT